MTVTDLQDKLLQSLGLPLQNCYLAVPQLFFELLDHDTATVAQGSQAFQNIYGHDLPTQLQINYFSHSIKLFHNPEKFRMEHQILPSFSAKE